MGSCNHSGARTSEPLPQRLQEKASHAVAGNQPPEHCLPTLSAEPQVSWQDLLLHLRQEQRHSTSWLTSIFPSTLSHCAKCQDHKHAQKPLCTPGSVCKQDCIRCEIEGVEGFASVLADRPLRIVGDCQVRGQRCDLTAFATHRIPEPRRRMYQICTRMESFKSIG